MQPFAEAHCGAFVIAEDVSNKLSHALYMSIQPIYAFMGCVHSSVSINFASLLSLRSVNLLRYDNCELRKRWQGAPLHVKRKTMHRPAHDRQLATRKDTVVHVRAKGILKCVYVRPSFLARRPLTGAVMQVQTLRILYLSFLFF